MGTSILIGIICFACGFITSFIYQAITTTYEERNIKRKVRDLVKLTRKKLDSGKDLVKKELHEFIDGM